MRREGERAERLEGREMGMNRAERRRQARKQKKAQREQEKAQAYRPYAPDKALESEMQRGMKVADAYYERESDPT